MGKKGEEAIRSFVTSGVFHYWHAMMKSYLGEGLLQEKCMLRRVNEINNDEIPCNPSMMQV